PCPMGVPFLDRARAAFARLAHQLKVNRIIRDCALVLHFELPADEAERDLIPIDAALAHLDLPRAAPDTIGRARQGSPLHADMQRKGARLPARAAPLSGPVPVHT